MATVLIVSTEAQWQLLLSHHITKTDGKNSMICNQHDGNTEPLLMVIKSLSSEEKEQSKLNRFEIANFFSIFQIHRDLDKQKWNEEHSIGRSTTDHVSGIPRTTTGRH